MAVDPGRHGSGIGTRLVRACLGRAAERPGLEHVFLATSKPAYFASFGFQPVSRWRLPAGVLLDKLAKVFAQPIPRCSPCCSGDTCPCSGRCKTLIGTEG